MGFKLFDVGKVGCYLESITHSTEKRKDGEAKVLQLSLKVDPFDVKLASALSQPVRATLFKLSNAEPQEHLRKVYVSLGTPRQRMEIFATPDTPKGSILLDHVRVSEIYARTSKDARGYVLVFKTIFGPPDARELEYCENWRNNMAFVTFTEAEASDLFVEDSEDDDDEDDDGQQALPDPEFETTRDGRPVETAADPAPPRRRRTDRKVVAKVKRAKGRRRR
jgi:hypothetical protein